MICQTLNPIPIMIAQLRSSVIIVAAKRMLTLKRRESAAPMSKQTTNVVKRANSKSNPASVTIRTVITFSLWRRCLDHTLLDFELIHLQRSSPPFDKH